MSVATEPLKSPKPGASPEPAPKLEYSGPPTYTCGSLTYTRRGLVMLFAWMLWGDFCFTLMEKVVPSVLPLKLHSLKSPDMVISLIMTSLPAVFNLTITPPLSLWSDRVRTPWGRRLPFILATMPFLTLSLVLIGFADSIGAWIQVHFVANAFDQATVTIVALAVFAAMFDLFNMFVNTVYWYLFNDVVPDKMLGRFMSYFKLVGTLAAMLYDVLVFRYAETHMRWIFLGAAALYLFGFGIVCLRVKEGTYPPAENLGRSPWQQLRTVLRECFAIRYYWNLFLEPTVGCLAGGMVAFGVFFSKSLGLSLANIGWMGIGAIGPLICYTFAGNLVDRWGAVRITAYFAAWDAFHCMGNWVWLGIDRPDPTLYVTLGVITGTFFNVFKGTIGGVAGSVRWWKVVPKDKLGQYSGAMCLIRAVTILLAGGIGGLYLQLCRKALPHVGPYFYGYSQGSEEFQDLYVYRLMFLFTGPISIAAFYFHYRAYRYWKRLGGEAEFEAPTTNIRYKDLPPNPRDGSHIRWWIVAVPAWSLLGGLLGSAVWAYYYIYYRHDYHDAKIVGISVLVSLALFAAWLRFVKFMERP